MCGSETTVWGLDCSLSNQKHYMLTKMHCLLCRFVGSGEKGPMATAEVRDRECDWQLAHPRYQVSHPHQLKVMHAFPLTKLIFECMINIQGKGKYLITCQTFLNVYHDIHFEY